MTQIPEPACPLFIDRLRGSKGGFSLIEVTLAIAIVAFAFIALIGLLPAGMTVFNQTIDSTNEMRISSDLSSLLQASEYNKLPTNQEIINNVFYFDVDGALLDTELHPIDRLVDERIYAARIFIDKQNIPALSTNIYFDKDTIALKSLVIVTRNNPSNLAMLRGIVDIKGIHDLPKQKVRVLPLVITKTDGKS